ncbi:MAG: hypothetical protein NZM35_05815 [Chitinophagales bacterium]|nr:hypothetical protein [Chitinophagales bacterium]MDW8419961.1 hypothetical protein [Chitinophagales bacterium]
MSEKSAVSFAHIVNPVNAPEGSELHVAQPVTFKSILRALHFTESDTSVALYCIGFPEDEGVAPPEFTRLPVLRRSVLDERKFQVAKKYPILYDVLQAVYEHSDAEYLIYTNMDIALMPYFYDAAAMIIKQEGCDALVINRRGIWRTYCTAAQLPLMYSEYGMPHPGFDCFIFHRSLFPKLILDKICLGVAFSEVTMIHNLIAFAHKLHLEDKRRLTFHIGTEVMPPLPQEYYRYNRAIYEQIIYPQLRPYLQVEKFPYAMQPFLLRMVKWMLNPSFRTHVMMELEGKSLLRRIKYVLDSWRFSVFDRW